MIIYDIILTMFFICTIVSLSGIKMMYSTKYNQVFIFIIIMHRTILDLIEGYIYRYEGVGFLTIITVLLFVFIIWITKKNKYIYAIHNTKEEDIINIITRFLDKNQIKYEVRSEEIYLVEENLSIFIRSFVEKNLDCVEIKDTYFYEELINELKMGIKNIKKRNFPVEGLLHLVMLVFLIWLRSI